MAFIGFTRAHATAPQPTSCGPRSYCLLSSNFTFVVSNHQDFKGCFNVFLLFIVVVVVGQNRNMLILPHCLATKVRTRPPTNISCKDFSISNMNISFRFFPFRCLENVLWCVLDRKRSNYKFNPWKKKRRKMWKSENKQKHLWKEFRLHIVCCKLKKICSWMEVGQASKEAGSQVDGGICSEINYFGI